MASEDMVVNLPQLDGTVRARADTSLSGRAPDARRARAFVASQLAGLAPGVVYTAQLLTSELVSNAVLHVGGAVLLTVTRTDDWVLVSVADDGGRQFPAQRQPMDTEMLAESGRGFQILASEAAEFGWHTLPDGGKLVWFTVATDPEALSQSG